MPGASGRRGIDGASETLRDCHPFGGYGSGHFQCGIANTTGLGNYLAKLKAGPLNSLFI